MSPGLAASHRWTSAVEWDYARPALAAPPRAPDRRHRLETSATAYGLTSATGLIDAVIAWPGVRAQMGCGVEGDSTAKRQGERTACQYSAYHAMLVSMPSFRIRFRHAAVVAGGVVLGVLGLFFFVVGLDDADKYASVIGAIAAVLGLALSLAGLRSRNAGGGPHEVRGSQRISGSRIGGNAVQLRGVSGDVTVRGSAARRPGDPPAAPPESEDDQEAEGGQTISRSAVGGDGIQVDQVDGDVNVDRSD